MFTVVETFVFEKQWPIYWSEDECGEFAAYIAESPNAGDVVPKSGGFERSVGVVPAQENPGVFV